jgi:uncharacterized membrane protein YccC
MTYDLESLRRRLESTLTEMGATMKHLVGEIDEAQNRIDSAREHLQAVVSDQRYVGTRVQEEAARALALLDGEPDGADA